MADRPEDGDDGWLEWVQTWYAEVSGRLFDREGSSPASAIEEIERAAEEGDPVMQRWLPVAESARDVFRHLWQLGLHVLLSGRETDVRAMLDELAVETAALVESFPAVADLYDDADAVDRWVDGTLDKSGVDDAFFRYLTRLRELVDLLIQRVVVRLFESDEGALSPERLERFLERLDAILREVVDRWVFDALVESGPGEREGAERDDRSGGRDDG